MKNHIFFLSITHVLAAVIGFILYQIFTGSIYDDKASSHGTVTKQNNSVTLDSSPNVGVRKEPDHSNSRQEVHSLDQTLDNLDDQRAYYQNAESLILSAFASDGRMTADFVSLLNLSDEEVEHVEGVVQSSEDTLMELILIRQSISRHGMCYS